MRDFLVRWTYWPNVKRIPKDCTNAVRHFIQRGMRGYSDRDAWNLNSHLMRVIAGCTSTMVEGHFGHPIDITDDEWTLYLSRINELANLWLACDLEGEVMGDEAMGEFFYLLMDRFADLWD